MRLPGQRGQAVGVAAVLRPQAAEPSQRPPLETVRLRWVGLGILVASLTLGTALRAWLAFHDDGMYWPDEIYMSLEPGHHLAFGYGLLPWEYVQGARTWVLPFLVAVVMKVSAFFGATEAPGYLWILRLTFSAVAAATAYGAFRLARVYGASTLAAATGGALFALLGPAIYFGTRGLSETVSALPVVLGFSYSLDRSAPRWQRVLGASLLGFAVLLRLQNAVFCVGLLLVLAARRQWQPLVESTGVFAVWTFLLGFIDLVTWHGWFHSADVYLRFSLSGAPASWGTYPITYYAGVIRHTMLLAGLLMAVLCVAAARRAPGLLFVALLFVFLHSLVPHKELRFILPAAPLFCALTAIGVDAIRERAPRLSWSASAAVLSAALLSAATFHSLTYPQLGSYLLQGSAYDNGGPVNRLLIAAGHQPDLCGIKMDSAAHRTWTGGFTYLNRRVPFYPSLGAPPVEAGKYNYEIATSTAIPSGTVVARQGDLLLIRLNLERCQPDPTFSWQLEALDPGQSPSVPP